MAGSGGLAELQHSSMIGNTFPVEQKVVNKKMSTNFLAIFVERVMKKCEKKLCTKFVEKICEQKLNKSCEQEL